MPTNPTIQIRYSTEHDAPTLGALNIASFKHQAYWANVFPQPDPFSVLPLKHARALEKLTAPDTHVLSAVDLETDQDEVVGWARWTFPGDENGTVDVSPQAKRKIEEARGMLPEGANRRIYELFFETLKVKRGVWLGEGDLMLDFLATHPSSQGKGIGTKLLKWGMEYADERDARIYLEATMDGYPLYVKHGWRQVEELVLDFVPYGGHGTATYSLMIRDRKSERETTSV
ncbi:GNAT family N-acetyltransferase [Aspergillus affinis]|uniref:GNAT family N-acetyltransferase n=1 Tax=Aspergillus affinis TaxID=1070780 RepID=UPI0022FF2692|nr:acyl-CoA N-acyltransferase [Aspergillus affinis]KAI9035878.1 acyl-CoA N-acyltransferase [Aspergillus affinis]